MVFAATVASAESAAEVLRQARLEPLVFHRDVMPSERDEIMQQAATR